jgi:hypothetical protein
MIAGLRGRNGRKVSLLKKVLIGVGITIAGIWMLFLPLALALMAGFPFSLWADEEIEPVGTRATFAASADCLSRSRAELELDSEKAASCFPPQTAAGRKALIACFNGYERNHPGHVGWPEDNMQGCSWDGVIEVAAPRGLTLGHVTPFPAVPRAGERFVVTVGAAGRRPGDLTTALETGALDVLVTIGDGKPLSRTYGARRFGNIYVELTPPKTAAGKRLTITLTLAEHRPTPTGARVLTYTVAP